MVLAYTPALQTEAKWHSIFAYEVLSPNGVDFEIFGRDCAALE